MEEEGRGEEEEEDDVMDLDHGSYDLDHEKSSGSSSSSSSSMEQTNRRGGIASPLSKILRSRNARIETAWIWICALTGRMPSSFKFESARSLIQGCATSKGPTTTSTAA